MSDQIIVSLISGGSGIIIAGIYVIVKDYIEKRKVFLKKEKDENITHDETMVMKNIQQWIVNFNSKYNFDRVNIFQFHNGGKFFSGKSIKKFSVSYEYVKPGYERIQSKYKEIIASRFPFIMEEILNKPIISYDLTDSISNDLLEIKNEGVQQLIIIPIYSIDNKILGFLRCDKISVKEPNIEQKFDELIKDGSYISGWLANNNLNN